ncbi:MAG TPA: type II secretion system F family protein [Thermoleophilaceae bacterium]|nr:type II secretion system F family protein [Thermoleophilaceae bacterium]
MATYAFKALDLAGATTKGEMEAGDQQAVATQLRSRGLIVVDIEEQQAASAGDILARFKRVKADDLVIASRQLATMVQSGMSLLRALYVIEEQTESEKLREVLIDVRKDVEGGSSLSEALRKHPDIFNDLYVAMVEAGETGGILDQTLVRVAEQLEKDAALRRQVKAAMIYPILIGSFALIVLVALVAFLVPVFEKIFEDFGGELPTITKFTVFLSHLVTRQWYMLIAGAFAVVWLFRYWKNSERGRVQWDRLKLKFPMKIGDIVQKVALARFSRTFSGLIAAGVPMLEAIEITGKTSGNRVVEMAMHDVRESVKKGGSLTAPMAAVPEAFPIMVTQMIGVGEETGALETMMSKVADFYEEQVEAAVKALTSILEPVMIIIVGGIVGFIVIAMYLPMFKVYDSIK